VELCEPPRRLRLAAEMKMPGRGWLEFEVVPRDGDVTIHQTAVFDPHGLGGLAPEHLARMRELAVPVARFGSQVRRPPRKEDAPASEFRLPGA
jgi:hypothetical protein